MLLKKPPNKPMVSTAPTGLGSHSSDSGRRHIGQPLGIDEATSYEAAKTGLQAADSHPRVPSERTSAKDAVETAVQAGGDEAVRSGYVGRKSRGRADPSFTLLKAGRPPLPSVARRCYRW